MKITRPVHSHRRDWIERMPRGRNNPPTTSQVFQLVAFLETKPELARGYARTEVARDRSRRSWREIGSFLNREVGGCTKSWAQWSKYWKDKKGAVKRKAALIAAARRRGGDAATEAPELSAAEQRILAIISGSPPKGHVKKELDPLQVQKEAVNIKRSPSASELEQSEDHEQEENVVSAVRTPGADASAEAQAPTTELRTDDDSISSFEDYDEYEEVPVVSRDNSSGAPGAKRAGGAGFARSRSFEWPHGPGPSGRRVARRSHLTSLTEKLIDIEERRVEAEIATARAHEACARGQEAIARGQENLLQAIRTLTEAVVRIVK